MSKPTTYEEGNQNKKALAIEAYRQALRACWELETVPHSKRDEEWACLHYEHAIIINEKMQDDPSITAILGDERTKWEQEQAND